MELGTWLKVDYIPYLIFSDGIPILSTIFGTSIFYATHPCYDLCYVYLLRNFRRHL
jgi:hypothetical protein